MKDCHDCTCVGAAQMSCLLNICVKACPFRVLTFSPTLVSTAQHDPHAVSFFLHTFPPGLTPVLNLPFCHPSLLSAVSPVHEFTRQLPFSSYWNLVANCGDSLAATVHFSQTENVLVLKNQSALIRETFLIFIVSLLLCWSYFAC